MASHDLSNPLQSLAVLLELAFDDLPPGGPAVEKLEQSVTATEQLRDLIRSLAAFARAASRRARDVRMGDELDASLGVCRRRLERQAITLCRATADIDGLVVDPAVMGTALLGALLGALRAAQASGRVDLELHLRGRGGSPATLELELRCADASAADGSDSLRIDDKDLARCHGALAGTMFTVARDGPAAIRFELAAAEAPVGDQAGPR